MSEYNKIKISSMNFDKERTKAENPLKIQDLTFNDDYNSLFATRGRTKDIIPIVEMMDNVGFWGLEIWGSATFEAMHRFLNEDPWERLKLLKRNVKKTRLSMLLRGQNLAGYKNYSDDIARAFVERAAYNGIDIFSTFDPLNDYRNFETVVPVVKTCGKHFQGCICYNLIEKRLGEEIYNLEYYIKKAKELEAIEANSICIKDIYGLMSPYDGYKIVKKLKEALTIPIHLHSGSNSGMSSMTYLKAIEAGVDSIGTCMSPYGFLGAYPALTPVIIALMGTKKDPIFNIKLIASINEIIENSIINKYKYLFDDTKTSMLDTKIFFNQIPCDIRLELIQDLKEMDALEKLDKVYVELPKVRKDLGQVPLVKPISQIVATQAINNVLFDNKKERYNMITAKVKDLCYGLYGKTPAIIDSKIQKKALKNYPKGQKPITCRAAEIIEPKLDKAKEDVKNLAVDLEDVLIYALYPITGKKFLKWKYDREEPPEEVKPKNMENIKAEQKLITQTTEDNLVEKKEKISPKQSDNIRQFNVYIDNEYFEVGVEEVEKISKVNYIQKCQSRTSDQRPSTFAPSAHVLHKNLSSPVKAPSDSQAKTSISTITASEKMESTAEDTLLKAPMPGLIISYKKQVGDSVKPGETIVILEAMKMENALPAPIGGKIKSINFGSGDSVAKNDVLCIIG